MVRHVMIKEKQERSRISTRLPHVASAADMGESIHRELVLRILASRSFARSERLSAMLKYVCDMTLKGCVADLNEQKIGQAVFGRSPDYDSSVDGIVRTQASRLRLRLDLYFEDEGIEEPIRVIIPKGGYVPVFAARLAVEEPRPATSSPESAATAAGSPPPLPVSSILTSRTQLFAWTLSAFLAIALAVVLVRTRGGAAAGEAILPHPLWSQIFIPQHATLEVPGDSGLVMFHRFSNQAVPLADYLIGDYRSANGGPSSAGSAAGSSAGGSSAETASTAEMRTLRADISNRRYTSIVDLDAAVTLAQIAQARHGTLQVRYPRDLRPNDLKNGNIILVGAFEANPWIELFERRMNFTLENNYQKRVFTVINHAPLAGEPAHWESVANDPQREVYGIVAFVPNLSGNGNALLIEGTAMAGTEAAWDFVSDDTELLPFLKKIQRPDGKVPHFELLLGTQNMGASAVHSNLLAWRVAN